MILRKGDVTGMVEGLCLFSAHYNDSEANEGFPKIISDVLPTNREVVWLCIGTDRSTGDSLGPIVGSMLQKNGVANVYGTLPNPVHAGNLVETLHHIKECHNDPFIVAVDACLGKPEHVGYIKMKEGPMQPGAGVNKSLPFVGDAHIVGIVNEGGFMEYFVLQNTRLNLVIDMANKIAEGIVNCINNKSCDIFARKPLTLVV